MVQQILVNLWLKSAFNLRVVLTKVDATGPNTGYRCD